MTVNDLINILIKMKYGGFGDNKVISVKEVQTGILRIPKAVITIGDKLGKKDCES